MNGLLLVQIGMLGKHTIDLFSSISDIVESNNRTDILLRELEERFDLLKTKISEQASYDKNVIDMCYRSMINVINSSRFSDSEKKQLITVLGRKLIKLTYPTKLLTK